jgi:hypothetical protein
VAVAVLIVMLFEVTGGLVTTPQDELPPALFQHSTGELSEM